MVGTEFGGERSLEREGKGCLVMGLRIMVLEEEEIGEPLRICMPISRKKMNKENMGLHNLSG